MMLFLLMRSLVLLLVVDVALADVVVVVPHVAIDVGFVLVVGS